MIVPVSDQDHQRDRPEHRVLEEAAHTLHVQHAPGDEIARVHAIVIAEGKPLQLVEVRQPQLVADAVPERFAEVVLEHGEEAARNAGAEHQKRGGPERRLGGSATGRGVSEQPLRVVHRIAQITRDQQLEVGRDDRADDACRHAEAVARGHAQDAHDHVDRDFARRRRLRSSSVADFLGVLVYGGISQAQGQSEVHSSNVVACTSSHPIANSSSISGLPLVRQRRPSESQGIHRASFRAKRKSSP